jgi:two-component system chemotaxis response regulator CheB
MAEYRIYTLDHARRIVRCQEAVCVDDRQAFIVSTTLGEPDAELEIWQSQRFVGRSTRLSASPAFPRRPLTTVDHRDPGHQAPSCPPASAPPGGDEPPDGAADARRFIAIGASGGEDLSDIADLLQAVPKPVRAVVLVVLHRPRGRISHLQQVLARRCGMPVAVAREGERFVAGTCYIGEPDHHLTIMGRSLDHRVHGAQESLRNRTIDALFTSLAAYAGQRAVGIVLPGALDDGSRGLAAIHAAQGLTMVLDPSVRPRGLQQNAIEHDGPIGFVGTAGEIAATLGKVFRMDGTALPFPA